MQLRTSLWQQQFILATLALVIIYPSEHLSQLEDPQLTYYMYLCGVYHSTNEGSSNYSASIYTYLVTLAVLMIERVCLSWESNRFGCDDEVFNIIKGF